MRRTRCTRSIAPAAVAISVLVGTRRAAADVYCPDQDIDVYPYGWSTNPNAGPGPEDFDRNGDGTFQGDPSVECIHLSAGDGFATMADGRPFYIFGFSRLPLDVTSGEAMMTAMLAAQLPAPTIAVRQGHSLYLTLTNVGMMMRPDLFDPHTVHWHGFPNASPFYDGLPEASVAVNMGASFTYYYEATEPGTYMYHCHVEAPEHMQMGMLGQIYVLPAQDGTDKEFPPGSGRHYTKFVFNDGDGSTGYDVSYAIQLSDVDPDFHDASLGIQPESFANLRARYSLLNGRGYPDTTVPGPIDGTDPDGNVYPGSQPVPTRIDAVAGQRILLRISSLSTVAYHTVRVLGIPMQIVGSSARILRGPAPAERSLFHLASSVTLGGGESVEVILDTLGVAPGTYYLHARDLEALNNDLEGRGGMMAEIHVL